MSIALKYCPRWALLSLVTNGLLALTIAWVLLRQQQFSWYSSVTPPAATARLILNPTPKPVAELGPRHQLNYQQWVTLLEQEAEVVGEQNPDNLTVLLGDSISLWFPHELLPPERTWLNQGISGETSAGLLNRLDLLDTTKPEVIVVMIGINDLIAGVRDETILANQRLIIRYLRRVHPQATIAVQSILPHSGEQSTWEGRDRLLAIPNNRIRKLNERLETIAEREDAVFLDLYPLFADSQGTLRLELSSDGLHLNQYGYFVWSNALQVFHQLIVEE